MQLRHLLIIALVSIAVVPAGAESHQRLQSARFFMDGERNPTLLAAVRKSTENKITFNRHFSIAFVDCGIGCGSYFFVDRRDGGVITAPESRAEDETTWDLVAKAHSDVIKVTFGPRDGVAAKCWTQHFRWSGMKFVPMDERSSVVCPR